MSALWRKKLTRMEYVDHLTIAYCRYCASLKERDFVAELEDLGLRCIVDRDQLSETLMCGLATAFLQWCPEEDRPLVRDKLTPKVLADPATDWAQEFEQEREPWVWVCRRMTIECCGFDPHKHSEYMSAFGLFAHTMSGLWVALWHTSRRFKVQVDSKAH